MDDNAVILLIVFIPIIGSVILPLIGKLSVRIRNILALTFVSASFVLSLQLLPLVLGGEALIFSKSLPLGFNIIFNADGLAVFMAIISSFLSAIIVLYSFGYISHYENQNEYYLMVVLFLGSMMGLIFSGDLVLLYLFWEITAITSWRLIGFFRETAYVLKADKAFLVTFSGAILMLLGFIMLHNETGTFNLLFIKQVLRTHPIPNIIVVLILAGLLSKSATLPFHTWLPDAGVAPSPVTALLHAAILVKIGVYVFARLFVVTFSLTSFWQTAVPIIAGVSALIAAGAALIDNDLKRIIAYSTVSQIGFIFLGLSSGNMIGITGGLLFILMHGLAKAALFLCAGIVEQNTKTKDITKLGGLITTMPVTAISFLLCAFSVMGIPPFGGFFSKYMVITGAVAGGHIYIALMFLIGAFLTILYLFRTFNMVFLGETKVTIPVKEGSPIMITCVALLAVLSLAAGIFIRYLNEIVETIVRQII